MKSENSKSLVPLDDTTGLTTSVLNAVKNQIDMYPESTLRDIYKSFFQDEYGPGHLLDDAKKARSCFDTELGNMQSRGRCCIEPCGRGCNFLRAPMDLILDGVIGSDAYFSAFLAGASEFIGPDPISWRRKWDRFLEILRPLSATIANFEKDSAEISAALTKNQYVIHHSEQYQRNYDPHYRLISIHTNLRELMADH